jgi:thioredoxin reductase (NADPH)
MQNSKTSRHVKVFGADWCASTQSVLLHLKKSRVPFKYINLDTDPASSECVKQQNQGKELKPTIVIGDRILAEPTNQKLDAAPRV